MVEAASGCFSDNPPNEIFVSLVERDIPPQKFIQDLESQFGQAVLDLWRSIRDPLYNESFLPFWVLTLWEQLAELNTARREWSSATTWLQRFSKTPDATISAAAESHLACIGRGAEITIGQERATALTLPQVLEFAHLRAFHAVHEADAHLQTRRHELIPARQLLTVLQKTPRQSLGVDIEISEEDRTVYLLLRGKTSEIDLALKYINSRKAGERADVDLEAVEQKQGRNQ